MKLLKPLTEPPLFLNRFVAIRDAMEDVPNGSRAQITANHDSIVRCYTALQDAFNNQTLEDLKSSATLTSIKAALQETYSTSRKPLRKLKNDIKIVQSEGTLKICPMCKMYSPRTFDHYLPQAKFPEYAVHPLNLVPCCQTCNGKKSQAWLNTAGERIFLYLYSDPIPQVAFVRCTLTPPVRNRRNVGVTFELVKPNNISQVRWEPIARHFDRLDLIERYNEDGNDELTDALNSSRDYIDSGGPGDGVRDFLLLGANRSGRTHGRSYWRAELRRQLAEAPDLLTWIRAPRRR